MKIQQFIKSLNNTEIGKGGTHDYYVRVSEKVENIVYLNFEDEEKEIFWNLIQNKFHIF